MPFPLRTDEKGCTPFYLAVQEGHIEAVKHLLQVEGLDVNLGQSTKMTPLIVAAMNGYVEIAQVRLSLILLLSGVVGRWCN